MVRKHDRAENALGACDLNVYSYFYITAFNGKKCAVAMNHNYRSRINASFKFKAGVRVIYH